jgi:adenosylcobinamide-GDP ribazoletransferase
MNFIKGFIINLQFFTSLPIHIVIPMKKDYLKRSIQSFPLLGLLQGAIYFLLVYILVGWAPFSSLADAFFLWLLTILFTGGIHLDGWIDASDAYFSYQDKGRRLEIMKDSRTGAFGVLSVIVLLSSRFLFIYEIVHSINDLTYFLILLLPLLSKEVMGAVLLTVPAAKKEGLAHFFQEAGEKRDLALYPVYLILLLSLFSEAVLPALIMSLVGLGSYFLIRRKAVKWFGGITGDVLGASVEGTENILWMTMWLLHYFVMV